MPRTSNMARLILTVAFLIFSTLYKTKADVQKGFITVLEEKLENNLVSYSNIFTKWLEKFNDKHLGNSELGKMLYYKEIRPQIQDEARGLKKLSLALIPVIFHVGATSTWLLVTALMAAKSVAIGIALLVFKIAVSSAKVASFFTAWKTKYPRHEPWQAHHDHGHYRSIEDAGSHIAPQYVSYNPDPVWNTAYKTLSGGDGPETYKEVSLLDKVDKN